MIHGLNLQGWEELSLTLYNLQNSQRYCQKVYKEVTTASSHVRSIIICMEEKDLVRRRAKGRIKYIILTKKGKEIAKDVLKLKQDLDKDLSEFEKK